MVCKIKNTVEKRLIIRDLRKKEDIIVFFQKHTKAAYVKIVIYLTKNEVRDQHYFL